MGRYLPILALGLALPVLSVVVSAVLDVPFAGGHYESAKYTAPALGWLETGTYGTLENGKFSPEAERLPAYPAYLAAVYWLTEPGNDAAVVAGQIVLAALTVLFTARAAAFIDRRWLWPAAILAGTVLNIGYRASVILPDLMFTFFTAGALVGLLGLLYDERRLRWAAIGSVFIGLGALTRPAFLLFPALTVPTVLVLLIRTRKLRWQRATSLALVLALGLGVFVGPWLAYTNHHFGQPVYSLQGGGHSLEFLYPCLQRLAGCGEPDSALIEEALALRNERLAQEPARLRDDPVVVDRVSRDLAIELIRDTPFPRLASAAAISLVKVVTYPVILEVYQRYDLPFRYFNEVPPLGPMFVAATEIGWTILGSLMLLTIVASRLVQGSGLTKGLTDRDWGPATWLVIAGAAALILVTVGIGNPRYRAPAEPYLLILSLMGGQTLLTWWRGRAAADASRLDALDHEEHAKGEGPLDHPR